MGRFIIASLSATLLLIVAAAALALGREVNSVPTGQVGGAQSTPRAGATAPPMTGSIRRDQLTATPTRPTIDPTTRLPDNPDTTKVDWFVPYLDLDAVKPRHEQLINGILLGPSVRRTTADCTPGSGVQVPSANAASGPFALSPRYLPADAVRESDYVGRCKLVDESTVSFFGFRDYSITADPQIQRFGGYLSISRWRGEAAAQSNIPSERWSAWTVAGQTAAVAPSILANGLGRGAVIIYSNGMMTAVEATGLPLSELVRIAEGLY